MVEPSTSTGILALFGLDGKLLAAQLVNFLIVVFVVHRWVYKPLLKVMDERASQIKKGLQQAEAAETMLREAQDRSLATDREAEEKAQQLFDRTKQAAEEKRRELLAAGKTELDSQVTQAKAQIQVERDQMVQSAKKEVSKLVVAATELVSKRSLSQKDQQSLVSQAIEEVT